ncbi:MAG: TldD/PmbA family protein [Chloroflexi bacterium]|nr:TldD/PmbA family protein [Chloroflexota bacterium]
MLEELLDKAKKAADQAEVFWLASRETPVSFEANRLKLLETHESTGVALRVIKDGRVGLASTSRLSDPDGLVARTLETVPLGPMAAMELPSRQTYQATEVYDPKVEGYPLDDMIQLGQSLIDRLRSAWPDVLWSCNVRKSVSDVRILNSRGCAAQYSKTFFSLGVEGTRVQDTDMLFVWEGEVWCSPITDTRRIVDTLLEQLELARTIVPAPQGKVPVILTPRAVAGVLLYPLLSGFNGKNIVEGASPLTGKLGSKLVDQRFSLWDDPTTPYAPGSRICDDEGIPAQRIPLIENGVIRNFLFDLQTAGKARARSTGSASRSLGTLPSPSASVLIIEEGETAYRDMVADMQDGLVVVGLLGAGQGNVLGGDFSANVLLGYRVRDGKIEGRVKNCIVSGNAYQLLKELLAIGNESRWVWGYLRTPALYCAGTHVASRG